VREQQLELQVVKQKISKLPIYPSSRVNEVIPCFERPLFIFSVYPNPGFSSVCCNKQTLPVMLIKESFADVQTTANGKESSMSQSTTTSWKNGNKMEYPTDERQLTGIFLFHPTIPGYPNA
jgi:hypothetical protein